MSTFDIETFPAGTRICTSSSTAGKSNPGFMVFNYKLVNNVWTKFDGASHAFVDLGFYIGTSPSDRPVW